MTVIRDVNYLVEDLLLAQLKHIPAGQGRREKFAERARLKGEAERIKIGKRGGKN